MGRLLGIITLIVLATIGKAQRSFLEEFMPQYRILQAGLLRGMGRTSEDPGNMRLAKQMGKLQPVVPDATPFPCPLNNTRSPTPPNSVHSLRPGDFDVTACMGDSLTAGNGLVGTSPVHIGIENRGISFAGGGRANWRKFVTLPNIMKEFNPKLIGYASRDSYTNQKESQFNVAEGGAISGDLPYMANVLVKRLRADKRVDISKHWKIVHIFMAANDFCGYMCYYKHPEAMLERHRNDLLATFRTLKKHLPRTFVNLVMSMNMNVLANATREKRPFLCYVMQNFECPCMFGLQFARSWKRFDEIMNRWQEVDLEVARMSEFDTEDFTVVVQPFLKGYGLKKDANGFADLSSLSADCFHISQKEGAKGALSIWNNMLEPVGKKSTKPWELFDFKCPSEEHPYIYTRRNG